jgi:hypothetical protein
MLSSTKLMMFLESQTMSVGQSTLQDKVDQESSRTLRPLKMNTDECGKLWSGKGAWEASDWQIKIDTFFMFCNEIVSIKTV